MDNNNQFYYQGPDMDYKIPLDDPTGQRGSGSQKRAEITTGGYHDLDYLKEQLSRIKSATESIFSKAEQQLASFALKIDDKNLDLVKAHDLVYPADDTPGYITFDEYKYLLTTVDTNAVQYVKSYYEAKLRGASGSTALDLMHLARAIHAEGARITTFIETYIGELDETAEFRVIELFQDWTEDTTDIIQELQKRIQTEVQPKLSQAELGKITGELSTKYQVLFQTKLNELNRTITEAIDNLEKNWNKPSDAFYNKMLGPALAFHIKITPSLTDPANLSINSLPTLTQEARGAISGLASHFNVAINDIIRRNKLFRSYCTQAVMNIDQRDVYRVSIKQLGDKGTKIPTPFVPAVNVDQDDAIYEAPHPLDHVNQRVAYSTALWPSHEDLMDRLLDDAHPQYLLKSGGTITGDIVLADGATIDGIIPSQHKHDGKDGSSKISGSDIIPGSISPTTVEGTPTTPVPQNLHVAAQVANLVPPGLTKVTTQIGFEITGTANIVGYEFEVVKLS